MSEQSNLASNLAPVPELYVSYESAEKLELDAAELTSHDLTPRQICDLEMLMNGGFKPLRGFLSKADYDGVLTDMRLAAASDILCSFVWVCIFYISPKNVE